MRFAVVIAPPGDSATSNDRLAALRERLMRGGANVVTVATSASLARDLGRAIDGVDEEDALFVYLAGTWIMTAPADGEASIALRAADVTGGTEVMFDAIGAVLRDRKAKDALLVLDGHVPGADSMGAAEHLDAVLQALGARQQGLEVLVGVHTSEEATWPFTRFLLQTLDDPQARDDSGAVTATLLYERVKEHPELAASVPSFAHVHANGRTFVVLPPLSSAASAAPPASRAPSHAPSHAHTRSSLPPPSSARRPRSVVPLPAVAPILTEAERAHVKGQWEEALEAYKKALMVLGEADPSAKASIYASIGEVKRAQGKGREAETNFDKALVADPKHRRSLDALIAMATEAKEWPRVVMHRKRLVAQLEDPAQKADALARLAEVYAGELHDPHAAAEALERATLVRPGDIALLQRLRATYEAMNRWGNVVDVIGAIADAVSSPAERGELRFQQADVTLARLREEARGLAMLEAALEDDPSHPVALSALVAVRTRRQEWGDLDRLYARLIDRFAEKGDPAAAWDACKRLGALRKERLHDGPGAIDAWQGALRCKPRDVETRAALAELFVAKGDVETALAELEIAAQHEPTRAATHRRLFELHRRAGQTDRAWLAATALEELGATNMDQDMLLEQFRPEGGVRASAPLDDAAWDDLLRAPGADEVVAAIMRAIASSAVAMRTAELREARKLMALDPARRQSESSTASIVRTFVFASKVLGVSLPDLYVLDDGLLPPSSRAAHAHAVPGGLAAAQVEVPATAIGPEVLSGKSVQELSFQVARHLTYYRPEHYVLVFYPTLTDLTALFLAAVKLALPEVPVPTHAAAAAAKLRKELERHATAATKVELAAAVERLSARGGKVDLAAWIRSVELTATRAGLLLCGDLAVALGELKTESRAIAELSYADKRADLLGFTASGALADLRARIGIAARPSLLPASPSQRPPPHPSSTPPNG